MASIVVACSSAKTGSGFGGTKAGGATSMADGGTPSAGEPGGGPLLGGGDGGQYAGGCPFTDATDHDGDGWSFADGDCNDCDVNVNPGAYDVPGNKKDEDCNGVVDDDGIPCDASLALTSGDAMDAARAVGLCKTTAANAPLKDKRWGVISARYVLPDGKALPGGAEIGHGLLKHLGGNKAQEGGMMLALSSGTARDPSDPGYQNVSGYDKGYTSGTPAGYPKESRACPGVRTGGAHDGVALELTLRVPTNAKSFGFEENFFTYEFPDFICSEFNDFYVAMMTPTPAHLPDANIAFDQDGNPISVNNSLLQVCVSQDANFKHFPCPLGPSSLANTGFDPSAATGWLKTNAPVTPGGQITLLLAIWDSGDGVLDSTVLIDNFTWSAAEASGTTTTPAPTR